MKPYWTAALTTTLATTLAGIMALGMATSALAQDQAEFERRRDAKMAESWFVDGGWTADYDEARKLAADSGKPIFAYFTRSYAP